jgi:channel protein (hemolysin III family)
VGSAALRPLPIYLLIAGTYTPFLAQMKSVLALAGLGLGVWLSAVIGIALKLALPGRFDRLAIVLCLVLASPRLTKVMFGGCCSSNLLPPHSTGDARPLAA